MIKSFSTALCVLALTGTVALAQSSQPQGGAAQSPTTPTASSTKDNSMTTGMSDHSMQKDGMKKDNMMKGGENKDGDGSMTKGGMSK